MNHSARLLLGSLVFAAVGCAKNPGTGPTSPPAAASASPDSAAGGTPKKPLRDYLGSAVRGRQFMAIEAEGKLVPREVRVLDEQETKRRLAGIDLDQVANGALVRCPSRSWVVYENVAGEKLGTLSDCNGHIRFDGPDRTSGGVRTK
jgi:hypothetical protein